MNSNLESFTCVWLDKNVHVTEDNKATLKELRQAINYLKIFDDSSQCEQYIRAIKNEKVVFIVSGSLGREIISRIHDLSQLSAIYVFCKDKKRNEEWTVRHNKVINVFTERGKLVQCIKRDQISRNKLEDCAWISVIKSGSRALEARNASFLWFQLFIEVLLRMDHKPNERKELLDICKNNYSENEKEMEIIKEFENGYTPEKAIWWYTRESCFYRILNKALRVQDFDTLFALRFFITDIAKQLKTEHQQFVGKKENQKILHVYRGQMIDTQELDLIRKSIGEYVSVNSFFSTSRKRTMALTFAQDYPPTLAPTGSLKPLIFEILIDHKATDKAFADITKKSDHKEEIEVLIILGALFRIDKVYEDTKDRLWVTQVSLASEENFSLKGTFDFMKKTIRDDNDLGSLGKILEKMGEYEQATKYYKRMYQEAHILMGNAALGLGRNYTLMKTADDSRKYLEESLELKESVLGEKDAAVGQCYACLGSLYWYVLHDFDKALSYLKKAKEIQEATLPSDSLDLAVTYDSLGTTYGCLKELDLSLDYHNKTLTIRKQSLPPYHPDIASTYNNLGCLHSEKKNYTEALEFFEKALEIQRQVLPPGNKELTKIEQNIRKTKDNMKK